MRHDALSGAEVACFSTSNCIRSLFRAFTPASGVGRFVRWQTDTVSVPLRLPRLQDTHLVLRAFADGDAHLIQDVSTDPFIPLITSVPDVPDIEAARAFIRRQQARLDDHAGYSFAIADPASNEALGQIGLWLPGLMQGRVSIGYWVAALHRGRGIAKHALALISTWGLGLPDVHRLELYVEPWNQASWLTAERVGYQREGLLRSWQTVGEERRDMYMYSLLPRDRP
jgi:ribosomal-protein-alanine N-acetyltransferase